MKYWEDFKVGESTDLGSRTISEAEILAFARKSILSRSTPIPRPPSRASAG